MEIDSTDIQKEIHLIEFLFQNKQLDEFIDRVEKHILPFLNKQQHLVSNHLLEKEKAHFKTEQQKTSQNKHQSEPFSQQKQKLDLTKIQQHHQKQPKVILQTKSKNSLGQLGKEQISTKSSPKIQQPQLDFKQTLSTSSEKLTYNKAQEIARALKKSKINILQKYEEMKLVLFKIEREMKKLETPMTEKGEWKVNKINSTSSIGVKTKGTLVEIRYEGVVQTNVFNLCVMIYLSQLWKEWVPFCTGSKTYAQPSPLQKIVLMDLKIPFLTERYSYLHGIAVDRITKNGKLYIYAEGISHEKDLLINVHKVEKAEYEKKVSKSVVLDAKYLVCQIGNQGNGKYMVKVYGMLDSHMPLLPEKVVNYIVKQLGGMIFEKIVQRAKDIKNTPWEKQLKQNQKREVKNMFYEWLNERIKNWDKTQTARKSKI